MCHLHLLSAGAGAPRADPPAPGCCPGRAPTAQATLQGPAAAGAGEDGLRPGLSKLEQGTHRVPLWVCCLPCPCPPAAKWSLPHRPSSNICR